VLQPQLQQHHGSLRPAAGVRAQLPVWRLQDGPLLQQGLSEGCLEAAQASMQCPGSSRSIRGSWAAEL